MYLVTGVEIETVTALQGTESLFLDGFAGSSSRAVLGQPLVFYGVVKICNRYRWYFNIDLWISNRSSN
jgi:hypothetical protein